MDCKNIIVKNSKQSIIKYGSISVTNTFIIGFTAMSRILLCIDSAVKSSKSSSRNCSVILTIVVSRLG